MNSAFLAEFVGMAVLIFLGNGVVANAVLNKTKGSGSGWMVITTGWAFAFAISIYIIGPISGAHLNPAFTIGMASIGNLPWAQVPSYIAGQMLGAMLGQVLVYLSYKQHYDETEDAGTILATFSTGPAIRNKLWNSVSEILATGLIVFVILGVTLERNSLGALGAYMVGVIVWSVGLSLGGTTGYALNPARDLGPRIVHQLLPIKNKGNSDWDYAIVPIVAPIIGAVLGAFLFKMCSGFLV